MKSETKMRDRDVLLDVIRRPREYGAALFWTGASGFLTALVIVLELFK